MTNKLRFVGIALAVVLLPAAAHAQLDRQDNEIAGSASLFQSFRGGAPNLTIAAHFGRLLQNVQVFGAKLQVGGDALFTGPVDFSGGGALMLFPQARLYFAPRDPRITPYAGAGLGLFIFKAQDVSVNFAYDLNGGIKYFVSPTTAAFAQIDLDGPITDPGSSALILSIGLSVFF